MHVEHAAVGQLERAIADADQGAALCRLLLDPGEERGIVAFHHGRHHDVIGTIGKPGVELGNRRLRLDVERRAHRHHAWPGRHGDHVPQISLPQDTIRNDIIRELGATVDADYGQDRVLSPEAGVIRPDRFAGRGRHRCDVLVCPGVRRAAGRARYTPDDKARRGEQEDSISGSW